MLEYLLILLCACFISKRFKIPFQKALENKIEKMK